MNFEGGYGLWTLLNNTTWAQINAFDVTTMITADLDNNGKADLIASFPTYGVWAFRNFGTWSQVHGFKAKQIAALHMDGGTQIDLVFDFGPGWGCGRTATARSGRSCTRTRRRVSGRRPRTVMPWTTWWSGSAARASGVHERRVVAVAHLRPRRISDRPVALRCSTGGGGPRVRSSGPATGNAKEPSEVAAQNRFLVGIAQERCFHATPIPSRELIASVSALARALRYCSVNPLAIFSLNFLMNRALSSGV